ncbi:hypothetical protein FJT64_023422 [Amphibalanus amphitrite]|uniref:Uncharacterized protein n=1 Tax=Amphibalanus amphitrite TaxID=1232801 RepID=A0A6A4WM36_AMPAM|nr:troponin T, cardiac muscle isoforms-like [Amphibalanus amphitrite]KAF0304844.1 hypothetical protein FJT64_023422 [Amphibalanus amphitrite]
MSTPSINDEADSELPSTEVPTTESEIKTTSTAGTGSTEDTTSGAASGSASTSESSSSVKKESSTTDGSPDSSPTTTSDTKEADGGEAEEGGGGEDEAEEAPPPPPPKPKPKKKSAPPPPPAGDAGEVDVAGDISMQYEKKFKDILRERRKKAEAELAAKNKNKATIDEMNAYYKAWVTADYEKRKEQPKSHEAAKKRRQDAVRQKKAQEAFCTWLQYKKQQLKMERRRYRLQRKERRQLVQKRSRAASERAYECWLAEKRRQHRAEGRPAGHYPPVVHTRDMSVLYAKSYKAAMEARGPRCASASGRLQGGSEFHDVENVYCPEHKTEYRLETKRTASGSCYRLTSVRKLD